MDKLIFKSMKNIFNRLFKTGDASWRDIAVLVLVFLVFCAGMGLIVNALSGIKGLAE
jgi:hypothetical protein